MGTATSSFELCRYAQTFIRLWFLFHFRFFVFVFIVFIRIKETSLAVLGPFNEMYFLYTIFILYNNMHYAAGFPTRDKKLEIVGIRFSRGALQ